METQHYKVRIKGRRSNPGKGVVPSPAPWCCSYCKGSLLIALYYGGPNTYYIYSQKYQKYVDIEYCLLLWVSSDYLIYIYIFITKDQVIYICLVHLLWIQNNFYSHHSIIMPTLLHASETSQRFFFRFFPVADQACFYFSGYVHFQRTLWHNKYTQLRLYGTKIFYILETFLSHVTQGQDQVGR